MKRMKKINITLWTALLAVVLSLASCDPMASVEYNIHNLTADSVLVTFHKEIMTSPYHGYDILDYDTVAIHFEDDSSNVAILAPNQHLKVHREWHGLYREEQIVHAWKYISSIKAGDTELAPSVWDHEQAWNHRTTGGGNFAKEESHFYDLWFR